MPPTTDRLRGTDINSICSCGHPIFRGVEGSSRHGYGRGMMIDRNRGEIPPRGRPECQLPYRHPPANHPDRLSRHVARYFIRPIPNNRATYTDTQPIQLAGVIVIENQGRKLRLHARGLEEFGEATTAPNRCRTITPHAVTTVRSSVLAYA